MPTPQQRIPDKELRELGLSPSTKAPRKFEFVKKVQEKFDFRRLNTTKEHKMKVQIQSDILSKEAEKELDLLKKDLKFIDGYEGKTGVK
jgi:hypothetical protein